MKHMKKVLAALLVSVMALAMLCGTAFAIAEPETEKTPAKRQEILTLVNSIREKNELPALVETPEADAQASKMAALYFSTDDDDAYDEQWMAILSVKVHDYESAGDCYSVQVEGKNKKLYWDIEDWNDMDFLAYPAWALLQSKDTVEVGIAFEKNGGAVIMPYMKPAE